MVFGVLLLAPRVHAAQDSCPVPLDESKSAPSVDLILNDGAVDRDALYDRIRRGFDSSTLEPEKSRIYRGEELPLSALPDLPYPEPGARVTYESTLPGAEGLVRARVLVNGAAFQMNLSLDTHAALARNALLRKLGYAIPSPRWYPSLRVSFPTAEIRDSYLDQLSSDTLTSRSRWMKAEPDRSDPLTVELQDLVLEPAVIEVPQLHWGILTPEVLNSRRSLRALLVPLTLLDLPESVNMFSFEAAKVFSGNLVFSRPGADAFKNETSMGDVRWIARKIAPLSRADWQTILHAGFYPPDIEALLLEKVLGRVNQLMGLAGVTDFKAHRFDPKITTGSVLKGKATRENYDGYALRFSYGDPASPLRSSELLRFFGISAINAALNGVLDQANRYLDVLTPDHWIQKHSEKSLASLLDHLQNHPNEPYTVPVEVFGGPVAGGAVNANRSIMTGTYFGSDSRIQLVDTVTANLHVGGFFGVSGLPKVGLSITPNVQAGRSYVHVRPLPDIKTAWKDSWMNVLVPRFMNRLSKVLNGKPDQDSDAAVKAFFDDLKPGELFIVSDSLSSGAGVSANIPLGALIGFLPSYGSLTAAASVSGSYGILSRTTILRTQDGLQIYLQRAKTGAVELELSANFFLKVIDAQERVYRGKAHTKAFVFPEKLEDAGKTRAFQRAIRSILKNNNPEILEEEFEPYVLDHQGSGNRWRIALGPFSWVSRVNFHSIDILPPVDRLGRYQASDFKRSVMEGSLTRVHGSDLYGFFTGAVHGVLPFLNLGSQAPGDDPSSNFMGRSHSTIIQTQIETSDRATPAPFVRIEHAFSGWSLRKERLLRILRKLGDQVSELAPGSNLLDPAEFTQTRKVQSFRVGWSLLLYSRGVDRLLEVLDLNSTGTVRARDLLADYLGSKRYRDYCEEQGLDPDPSQGPSSSGEGIVEASRGRITQIECVTPFMEKIFRLRSRLAGHAELFDRSTRDPARVKEKIRLLNRSLSELDQEGNLQDFLLTVGKENSFFQTRVSGFRTRDENGDSEYFSNTLGLIDQTELGGPLSDIASDSGISSNEIEARYLSNGY